MLLLAMDKTRDISARWLKNEIKYINELRTISPIIVTGVNKIDIQSSHTDWKKMFPDAIKCSAKNNYCLDNLFISIARKLTGNDELTGNISPRSCIKIELELE